MSDLEKKSILGGASDLEEDAMYKILKDVKVPASQEVDVVNPLTGNRSLVTINSDGTTDEKAAAILIHPEASKEQKEVAIAAWLFERGRENSSFLMELFQSKGLHTKETRQFKTQMRFDFESFVNLFTAHLDEQSEAILKNLHLSVKMYDEILEDVVKSHSIQRSIEKIAGTMSDERRALVEIAARFKDEAESLRNQTKKIAEERMKEKGYGIYIDSKGEIYSIFDKDFLGKVERDKEELTKEATKDKQENKYV